MKTADFFLNWYRNFTKDAFHFPLVATGFDTNRYSTPGNGLFFLKNDYHISPANFFPTNNF